MDDVRDVIENFVKCSIRKDVRNNGEFEVIEVGLNRWSCLDSICFGITSDSCSDLVTTL